MNHIVFPGHALHALREELLGSTLERAALLLAEPVQVAPSSWRLLVSDTIHVADQSYSRQSSQGVEIPPQVLAPVLKRARREGNTIVLVHTHPWDGPVEPSPIDRKGEAVLLPTLFQRIPTVPHARLILGHKDTHGALFQTATTEASAEAVGVGSTFEYSPTLEEFGDLEATFDRQVRAFGKSGQLRLRRTRVSIIGLGGTGSIVAQELAYLGVENFLLIDPDVVEHTNLNRIVGASLKDVGSPKVRVAAQLIRQINPAADVISLQEDVVRQKTARSVVGTDFFLGCTDSHGSRAVLTQLSYQYFIPGIDLGVRIEVNRGRLTHIVGRVQMLAPGLACTSCTRVLDPEAVRRDLLTEEERRADPYIVGAREPQPSVISLNTTVSGLAVSMFMAAVTGAPMRARHQIVLFDSGKVKAIENTPDLECAICSPLGFYGRGDSWPLPGRPE